MNASAVDNGARLLLVEDSDTQALRIRRMLEQHGFQVERVESGEVALDRLAHDIPDLVIADYHLPGMNGGQMARQIRMSASTRLVPVLMLTEGAEPGLEREGLESGADAYVSKSALPEVLVLRIRALLRQTGRQGGEDALPFRRARIVVLTGDDTRSSRTPGALVALLSRDGHLVTEEHDPDGLIESGWLDPDRAPDCIVVDLVTTRFDGVAFCRRLDALRQRVLLAGDVPLRILGLCRQSDYRSDASLRLFEAGVDDLVPEDIDSDVLALRIRVLVRRKLGQDEIRRQEDERRAQEAAVASARLEASVNAAKASLAGALEQANRELAHANHALIEAQGKLVQSAKMASLGELVAGIAHEINNPLAFTIAHKDTVERALDRLMNEAAPPDAGTREALLAKCRARVGSMALGLKRIQNLVLSLRKFSRLDEGAFQEVDVPEAVDVALALLTHKIGPGIVIETDLRAPAVLYCQPALLNQVVMNLLSNAIDAIVREGDSEGRGDHRMVTGRIRIATRLYPSSDSTEPSYIIEVEDSGPGIPPETRERIFEPFFTTKPVGAGTGLGLAIAYGVMQAHHGAIAIDESGLGGARFTLTVPYRALEAPDTAAPYSSQETP
nr:response regulator [Ameyamaea chiangmaiensis]